MIFNVSSASSYLLLASASGSLRSDLTQVRDCFFWLLLACTAIVAVGVVLEEAESWFPSGKPRLDSIRGIPISPPLIKWKKALVRLGWKLLIIGVIGEGVFEGFTSWADGTLQDFNNTLLAITTEQAGNAMKSAKGAADAASRAQASANATDLDAKDAKKLAGHVASKAEELDRRLVVATKRLEDTKAEAEKLKESLINLAVCNAPRVLPLWSVGKIKSAVDPLRPFADRQAVIEFVPEPEAKRAANNIVLALINAGWKIVKVSPADNIEDGVEVQPRFVVPLHDVSQEQLMQAWANTTRASHAAEALIDFLHSYNWQARLSVPPAAERADIPLDGLKVRVGLYPAVVYVAPPGAKDFTEAIARNEQEREKINKEVESEILKRNEEFLKRLPPKEAEKAAIELRVLREQRKKEEKLRRERDSGPCRPLSSLLPSLQ